MMNQTIQVGPYKEPLQVDKKHGKFSSKALVSSVTALVEQATTQLMRGLQSNGSHSYYFMQSFHAFAAVCLLGFATSQMQEEFSTTAIFYAISCCSAWLGAWPFCVIAPQARSQ